MYCKFTEYHVTRNLLHVRSDEKLWYTGCPTKHDRQLINSFECRLPCTVLDTKGCLQFISFKKSFALVYFTIIWLLINIFIIVFRIKKINGRRHSKLFIPTVMIRGTPCICKILHINVYYNLLFIIKNVPPFTTNV